MAIDIKFKETSFGVGDVVRVHQNVSEGDKARKAIFEGMVIDIRGSEMGRSFVVRRIGSGNIGIEQIFPVESPTVEKVEVVREGKPGVRHAKLYYTRDKSKREIESIYTRAKRKNQVSEKPKKHVTKKVVKKSPTKKVKALKK